MSRSTLGSWTTSSSADAPSVDREHTMPRLAESVDDRGEFAGVVVGGNDAPAIVTAGRGRHLGFLGPGRDSRGRQEIGLSNLTPRSPEAVTVTTDHPGRSSECHLVTSIDRLPDEVSQVQEVDHGPRLSIHSPSSPSTCRPCSVQRATAAIRSAGTCCGSTAPPPPPRSSPAASVPPVARPARRRPWPGRHSAQRDEGLDFLAADRLQELEPRRA